MTEKKQILVVDDTEINRFILADILEADYEIHEASSGLEAVNYLRQHYAELSLVLLDIVMPEMDGFEVLAVMNKAGWLQSLPVIMISAELSSTYIDHAYDLGATDYITRPFDEKTVQRRVSNTIQLYTKQKTLENMVTEQIMEKERTNSQMVEILSNIVEFRNGESGLHVMHIRIITELLLQALRRKAPQYELTSRKIALITNASALHDIGKISIPESILNKPGRFTPEEYEIMKTHSAIGAQMLKDSDRNEDSELLHIAYEICRWHHERYDGRGYPDGLQGEDIPISAQVVSLADVYDALTSVRVYKPPFPHEKAIEMIKNGECGAFSPLILECLDDCDAQLQEAVRIDSPKALSAQEAQRTAAELLAHGELKVSGQTLLQLEQERAKFKFFVDNTDDLLLEYDRVTDILEFSPRAAEFLHTEQDIRDPAAALHADDFVAAVRDWLANPQGKDFTGTYALNPGGIPVLCFIRLRLLHAGEDSDASLRIVGRIDPVT